MSERSSTYGFDPIQFMNQLKGLRQISLEQGDVPAMPESPELMMMGREDLNTKAGLNENSKNDNEMLNEGSEFIEGDMNSEDQNYGNK